MLLSGWMSWVICCIADQKNGIVAIELVSVCPPPPLVSYKWRMDLIDWYIHKENSQHNDIHSMISSHADYNIHIYCKHGISSNISKQELRHTLWLKSRVRAFKARTLDISHNLSQSSCLDMMMKRAPGRYPGIERKIVCTCKCIFRKWSDATFS